MLNTDTIQITPELLAPERLEALREMEHGKIACGKAHFAALSDGENPAKFMQARTLDDVMKVVG